MIRVLIPLAGNSPFFSDASSSFPKPLFEVAGLPMIQRALTTFDSIREPKRFVFVIKKEHVRKFHLDNTLRLLTNENCDIVVQEDNTKGAACSCLLAIDHIAQEDPLIISNGDQIIRHDIDKILRQFRGQEADAGLVCFDSVHPQWSYARLDQNAVVTEVAEKNPISRNAIAGFYYYRLGADLIRAAKGIILKNNSLNGLFYVSQTMNELILDGRHVRAFQLDRANYYSFYSIDRIREYERLLDQVRLEL